jgi:GT2 family glycosyltransferase
VRINRDRVDVVNVVRLINHAGSALRGDGAASEIGLGAPDDGRFDERADRFAFSGTAPVWRTETLHRLGSLATPFFAYNEDTDWCFRAQLAGMRIVYEPSAVVRHRLSATSGGGNEPLVRFLAERNAVLSLVRNAPRAVAQAAVRSKFEPGANERVRRSVRRRLPWAVASRLRLRRLWTTSPAAVWARWAEEGLVWPTAPADMAWIAGHAAPGDRYRAS